MRARCASTASRRQASGIGVAAHHLARQRERALATDAGQQLAHEAALSLSRSALHECDGAAAVDLPPAGAQRVELGSSSHQWQVVLDGSGVIVEADGEVGGLVALVGGEAVEVREQTLAGLVAIVGVLGQQALDDRDQRR